jgi:3-methyladenine DNA glycosylase AlkD
MTAVLHSPEQKILQRLQSLQDTGYRDFQSGLIPTADKSFFIGVRTPALRALAHELARDPDTARFLDDLPHRYFDENQLHAFLISEIRDFSSARAAVDRFLPYVDNWATCDQLSPGVFRKHHAELLPQIRIWLASGRTYTVRFAVGMLMQHFLDDDFDPAFPELVAGIRSEEYYVRMMAAWYFATALAKQYDAVIGYLEDRKLDPWTHNKTIQKAIESYRVSDDRKQYLRTLRIARKRSRK